MSNAKQLHDKMLTSQTFKKQMDKASQNYYQWTQQAQYSNLSVIQAHMISKFQTHKTLFDIHFIFAVYQPSDQKLFDKMLLNFITKIPKPNKPYSIVYVNDDINGGNKFTTFKNLFVLLPLQYHTHLQRIYLLKPSLRNKASKFFSFHTLTKFINNKTSQVLTLQNLCENIGIKIHDVFKYLPQKVRESFNKQEQQLRESIGGLQKAVFKQILAKPQILQQKPKQINQYEKSERGVPELLELLIYYFKQNQDGLLQEGIFRKSVSIEQQTQTMALLAQKQYSCLQKIKNPHIVANVIKRFFAKLATPVIPYEQFQQLMKANPLNVEKVAQVTKKIQNKNMTKILSLIMLLQFLIKSVIPKQKSNKMSAQNVSICFAPCLMWAQQRSIKDIVFANKSVQVMIIMLQNFQQIFGTKKEQKKLFRNSYVLQKKQSLSQAIAFEQKMQHEKTPNNNNPIQYRRTPFFGQLVITHTQSHLEEQDDQTNSNNFSSNQHPIQTQIQQSPQIKSQRPKSLIPPQQYQYKEQNIPLTYQPISHKKEYNLNTKQTKQQQQSNQSRLLQIPKPKNRGIFSSHIGFDRSSKNSSNSKSAASNKSGGSIHSMHSQN